MMAFGKLIYVIVCLYLCLIAKGSGYYISSTSETWQAAGTYCELAQPKYQYKGSGVLELNDTIEIDGDIPEAGVWIGYFKAFTEFEFEGCGMNNTGNITYTVYSLAQCHHLCGGTHIGLIGATSLNSDPLKMTCVCINTLTNYLINNICISCGDIICGKDTRRAVYSVLPVTTSEERTDDFNYLCKVSTSNPNASAWVHCSDTYTSNTRGVWCRQNESAQPFVSGISFSAWNTANDYCANNRSFPSSAVGFKGSRPFNNMTFTNIRREWTLHPGNAKVTTPSTSGQSDTSSKKSSQESSTTVIASAVTVAVVLSSALVIVIVLRNKGKLCFAITKGLQLENTDDSNRVSLAKIESKTNENSQSPEAYLYNKNTRGCTKDIDEYADIDNDTANLKCNETGFYQTPCAPMMNHTYQEIHANDEYAGIDDVRGDNDDYDYTNKAFRDEKAESSDNVYSHLNSGGDEYDHVHRGQNIVKVVEHDYVETSGVVRN